MPVSDKKPILTFEARERELLSFNLMFRDENGNFVLSVSCFETRTQIKTIFARISKIIFFLSLEYYLRKKAVNSPNFLKIICIFSQEIWMKILFFEAIMRISYCQSVSIREREIKKWILKAKREKMKITFTGIPGNQNSLQSLSDASLVGGSGPFGP